MESKYRNADGDFFASRELTNFLQEHFDEWVVCVRLDRKDYTKSLLVDFVEYWTLEIDQDFDKEKVLGAFTSCLENVFSSCETQFIELAFVVSDQPIVFIHEIARKKNS